MSIFNFKSQICTTREQSERLLALGLKKETADCCYYYYDGEYLIAFAEDAKYPSDIPAWSLHRLIEMMPESIHLDSFANTHYYRTLRPSKIIYIQDDCTWLRQFNKQNDFDNCVDMIEWLIKEGYFPKEYLV